MARRHYSPLSYVPSKGLKRKEKKQTVPSQSMTLKEILDRFIKGEKVPIQKEGSYIESDIDLEKVQHMDLVDREEFINHLKDVQRRYKKQEDEKVKAAEKAKAPPQPPSPPPPAPTAE